MPIRREPLEGLLIEHGSDRTRPLSAFLLGHYKRIVVVIGGQMDGYFSLPFMRPLAKELDAVQWSTCLTRFGSTFIGSRDSHVSDATDLKALVDLLAADYGAAEVCLFGWDTGVQVVLEFLASFQQQQSVVTRVILNGAVVDPAASETACGAGTHRRKEYVEKAIAESRRHELLPPAIYDKDVTVGRVACGGSLTVQEAVWQPAVSGNAAALRDNLRGAVCPLLVQVLPGPGYAVAEAARADVDHFVSSNAPSTEVYVDFIDNSADERRDVLEGTEAQHVGSVLKFLESADKRRVERVEEEKNVEYESSRRQRSVLYNSDLAYSK